MVFAENGDVGDDVHGGDVACDDDHAGEGGVSGGGSGGFAEGFDDFFDAALEGAVFGGYLYEWLADMHEILSICVCF